MQKEPRKNAVIDLNKFKFDFNLFVPNQEDEDDQKTTVSEKNS